MEVNNYSKSKLPEIREIILVRNPPYKSFKFRNEVVSRNLGQRILEMRVDDKIRKYTPD